MSSTPNRYQRYADLFHESVTEELQAFVDAVEGEDRESIPTALLTLTPSTTQDTLWEAARTQIYPIRNQESTSIPESNDVQLYVGTRRPLDATPHQFRQPRWAVALAAMIMTLFVVFALVVYPHLHHQSAVSPPTTAPCRVLPSTPGNADTQQGITVHVTRVYADMSRTVVAFQISDLTGKQTYGSSFYYLQDGCGRIYPIPDDLAGNRPIGGAPIQQEFAPLPESVAGTTATLVFVVPSVQLLSQTPTNPIHGSWKVVMHVPVERTTSLPIAASPQTHHGLTVQLVYADWTLTNPQFDGFSGGLRIRLHLSGLPPQDDTEQFQFSNSGGSLGSTSFGNGGNALLTLIDGQQVLPTFIAPATVGTAPPTGEFPGPGQFVTKAGEADIDLIYLTSGAPQALPTLASVSKLTLDQMTVVYTSVSPHQNKGYTFPGPWTFPFPANAACIAAGASSCNQGRS